jgi:hypothetical protein
MNLFHPGNPDAQGLVANEGTRLVLDPRTGAAVGGIGANHFRPWVFPFYAPSGRTVVQAFPHAHPWHNGIFAGQNPVLNGGRTGNFWAVPPIRCEGDPIFQNVGRVQALPEIEARSIAGGAEFRLNCVWRDEGEAPFLTETRTVRLFAAGDAHFCDVTSTRHASHGALRFPKTKFGGMGLRAEPLLSPDAGATVIADQGRRGAAEVVHEQDSDFVAYEAGLPFGQGGPLGVCMMIRDAGARGPWFIRDFGMAMYNPTWRDEIEVPENSSWTISLRVVAYDEALTDERVSQWKGVEAGPAV